MQGWEKEGGDWVLLWHTRADSSFYQTRNLFLFQFEWDCFIDWVGADFCRQMDISLSIFYAYPVVEILKAYCQGYVYFQNLRSSCLILFSQVSSPVWRQLSIIIDTKKESLPWAFNILLWKLWQGMGSWEMMFRYRSFLHPHSFVVFKGIVCIVCLHCWSQLH